MNNTVKRIEQKNYDYEGSIDYDFIVYGTHDLVEQSYDTLASALNRYMNEYDISTSGLARMTGIPKCTISRYLNRSSSHIDKDYLAAICIALRLRPCRMRHLFTLADKSLPDERRNDNGRNYIINEFLEGCFFDERLTVSACNKRLNKKGLSQLTSLSFGKEDK